MVSSLILCCLASACLGMVIGFLPIRFPARRMLSIKAIPKSVSDAVDIFLAQGHQKSTDWEPASSAAISALAHFLKNQPSPALGVPHAAKRGDSEELHHMPQPEAFRAIVDAFLQRKRERNINPVRASDKMFNPLIVLSGSPQSGKSSVLAQFAESDEYKQYTVPDSIVIPVNIKRGNASAAAHILYACLVAAERLGGDCSTWEAFQAVADSHNRFSWEIYEIVKTMFGEKTRRLLLIDDIANAADPVEMISVVGYILNSDPCTDVVLTADSPSYINNLLASARAQGRRITFIPWGRLPADLRWPGYIAAAEALLSLGVDSSQPVLRAIPGTIASKLVTMSSEQKKKLLLATPVLASGHPGTVRTLTESIRNPGPEWQQVLSALAAPSCSAGALLRVLCNLPCFSHHFQDVSADYERSHILSTDTVHGSNWDVGEMPEQRKCDLILQDGHQHRFFVTTNLAAFFRMADQCRTARVQPLGDKSRFLRDVFGGYEDAPLSSLWVRARALAVQIRLLEHRWRSDNKSLRYSLSLREREDGYFRADMTKARVAGPGEMVRWESGVVVVREEGGEQAGWDLMLCAEHVDWDYYWAKVQRSPYDSGGDDDEDEDAEEDPEFGTPRGPLPAYVLESALLTVPEKGLVDFVARRIKAALDDRFAVAEASNAGDVNDLLARIAMVFSVYEDIDFTALTDSAALLTHIPECITAAEASHDAQGAMQWRRAAQYVQQQYAENVHFLDKGELERMMPMVLWPIAALVRAATDGTDVE